MCLLLGAFCAATMSLSAQPDTTYAAANRAIDYSVDAVLMGNSITAVWERLDPQFFADHRFVGRGIGGQVTSQMVARFQQDVVALRPKVVVIMGGINDLGFQLPLDSIMSNLASMCEMARSNGIRPVLCSVMPVYRFPSLPDLDVATKVVELNVLIRAYAKERHIAYVDYYTLMSDSRGGLMERYTTDAVHPNAEGCSVMQLILMQTLPCELKSAGCKVNRHGKSAKMGCDASSTFDRRGNHNARHEKSKHRRDAQFEQRDARYDRRDERRNKDSKRDVKREVRNAKSAVREAQRAVREAMRAVHDVQGEMQIKW